MTLEEVADHEAAHASMARLLDLHVKAASVIPDNGLNGHVLISRPDGMHPADYAVKRALVTLAGMLVDDEYVVHRPTVSTSPTRGDAHDLARVVEALDLNDAQYRKILETAERLMLTT